MSSSDKGAPPGESMGEAFTRRRREKAAAAGASSGGERPQPREDERSGREGVSSGMPTTKRPSFLDIQREQEQEERQRGQRGGGGGRDYDRRQDYDRRGGPGGRYGGGGGGRSRGGGAFSGRRDDRSALPLEQGVVMTLRDAFGFIKCADRDADLFFHYSEARRSEWPGPDARPEVGDEVEFRVGPGRDSGGGGGDGDGRMAAYDVCHLEPGTVVWETEDEPVGVRRTGVVDRAPRDRDFGGRDRGGGGNASSAAEGTIRLEKDDAADNGGASSPGGSTPLVRFVASDFQSASPSMSSSVHSDGGRRQPQRLGRNDVVEFTLVTEKRTGKKFARDVTLVRSERDRLREEREAKLLSSASKEQGVVSGLREDGGFGFLRSNKRREEIYFRLTEVAETEPDQESERLSVGQNAEFLVVKDDGGRRGAGTPYSARQVKLLPPGTVKFHDVITEGVTGVVISHPIPMAPAARARAGTSTGGDTPGKVRLHQPLTVRGNEEEPSETEELVTDLLLHTADSPGGTFSANRDGTELGVWVREGDTLLFDVVRDLVDGTYRAAPTRHLRPEKARREERGNDGAVAEDDEQKNDEEDEMAREERIASSKSSVRLIAPSLAGRAEGVVSAVRDNYGFIHCAERGVDAYFRLYELFPLELQEDFLRNLPIVPGEERRVPHGATKFEVGMEVSFDLSLQGTVSGSGSGRNQRGQDRENLKAQRIEILPPGSVFQHKMLATGIKATVVREDPKQLYAGNIELESPEGIRGMAAEERHPLVAKLLDSILKGTCVGDDHDGEVTFHDVQSEKENQIVISMVEALEGLEWSYVGGDDSAAGGNSSRTPRRIHISRTADGESTQARAPATSSPSTAVDGSSNLATIDHSTNTTEGASSVTGDRGGDDSHQAAGEVDASLDTSRDQPKSPKAVKAPKKKKPKKPKVIKTIRYDKHSIANPAGGPPGEGDVVVCDIVQSRRTGSITVENLRIVERKMIERGRALPNAAAGDGGAESFGNSVHADGSPSEASGSGVGLVTEVLHSRQFGFITLLDENAPKREVLFFHFNSIVADELGPSSEGGSGEADTAAAPSKARATNMMGDELINKHDEVKFDFGIGKNGKRIALNVQVLPHGTLKIPSKTDRNACRGYVLMEPSHTSLANTPSHITKMQGPAQGAGRWDNVGKIEKQSNDVGSNLMEEGRILLLADPANLFAKRSNSQHRSDKKKVGAAVKEEQEAFDDVEKRSEVLGEVVTTPESTAPSDVSAIDSAAPSEEGHSTHGEEPPTVVSAVGTHVSYKTGAVALRGMGATSSVDNSAAPRRGDLVTFLKGKGAKTTRDIRVLERAAATTIRGVLTNIKNKDGTAQFVAATSNEEEYDISLTEVVSCDVSILKDKESVEGIFHDGKIYGVCRTKDIFLESKLGKKNSGLKERPRLNLTVRKELKGLGGKIMAQSGMAKGPDGTHGFAPGWTKRVSAYAVDAEEPENEEENIAVETAEQNGNEVEAIETAEQAELAAC